MSEVARAPARDDSGYAIVGDVLDKHEVAAIVDTIDASTVLRGRGGARHLMKHPAIQTLASDPRLLAIADTFVGSSAVPYRATLFDKSAARNWLVTWHQDTALPLTGRRDVPGWGPWSVKAGVVYAKAPATALARIVALRVHLDDSRADNGPLRVVPGTHTLGVLADAEISHIMASASAIDCLVASGGIVAMRPLILHASSKAISPDPRRVLHIEYADALELEPGLRMAIA